MMEYLLIRLQAFQAYRFSRPCNFKIKRFLQFVFCKNEVTKRVYFIGNERMLIAHDSNRLRFG